MKCLVISIMKNQILIMTLATCVTYVFSTQQNINLRLAQILSSRETELKKKREMTAEEKEIDKKKCLECWETQLCGVRCKEVCNCSHPRDLEKWHS